MTLNEFLVLTAIYKIPGCSQRTISKNISLSLGTVNSIYNKLCVEEKISEGRLTKIGLDALEPYKVKRAILLAAGFGSRMVPITLNTPKPLVRVHGVRIIETLLDALVEADITEIYIVRGYLKDQFNELLLKYPFVKFIDNPLFNETNNISSLICALEYLPNSYVMESDLFLKNKNLITKYQYESNYLGIYKERTDDYCFTVKNGYLDKSSKGGINCFQTVGICYVSKADGENLSKDIIDVFYNTPGGKDIFWGQVANVYKRGKYHFGVRQCSDNDVIEIDSFRELKQIDKAYDI